jgi:hypothetical protein
MVMRNRRRRKKPGGRRVRRSWRKANQQKAEEQRKKKLKSKKRTELRLSSVMLAKDLSCKEPKLQLSKELLDKFGTLPLR